jgi:hypothetical protein
MFVKTIEQIRRENFATLVEEAGGVTRFAEKMEKSQSQFSQIIHGAPDSKTGKPKEIGSKLARAIESRFGKDIGWMDHEPEDQEYQAFKKLPAEVRAWIINHAHLPPTSTNAPKRLGGEQRQREQSITFQERRKNPFVYKGGNNG